MSRVGRRRRPAAAGIDDGLAACPPRPARRRRRGVTRSSVRRGPTSIQATPSASDVEHPRARRRHPLRQRAGEAQPRDRRLRIEARRARAAPCASTMPRRRQRVVGDPVDEGRMFLGKRRRIEDVRRSASAGCALSPSSGGSSQTTPITSRVPSGTATMSPGADGMPLRDDIAVGAAATATARERKPYFPAGQIFPNLPVTTIVVCRLTMTAFPLKESPAATARPALAEEIAA